jgi:adenine deaminase
MNARDMTLAAQRVVSMNGGMAAVLDGQLLAENPFPVGGLMTTGPVSEVAARTAAFRQAIGSLGLDPTSPIMPFLVFTLPAGPGAKVTDLGLWDDRTKEFVTLLV